MRCPGASQPPRKSPPITRDQDGSTLLAWDVNQDCITEHDRRHALVADYVRTHSAADERAVAAALWPILESFARVAYPEDFPPGSLLGPFLGTQRLGATDEILNAANIAELQNILDYANKFHHDTNLALRCRDTAGKESMADTVDAMHHQLSPAGTGRNLPVVLPR